ncbi:MAG: NAD(P)H-dependent glycerol-3-phosphate dehydrogenase [Pyrinomonadaceae bacterium]|nr:NAD(P)H-dependent glycerol-3-phosphate dehydrogenase [Phycisphaerales bacterium]
MNDSIHPHVTILGSGQMGLVCASILAAPSPAKPAPAITIWSHSPEEAGELTQTRKSDRLPGYILPDGIRVSSRLDDAVAHATLIVSAIPVQFMRRVWTPLGRAGQGRTSTKSSLPHDAAVVSVAKGIENTTLLRPSQIVAVALQDNPDAKPRGIAVLSGPTIASELARCLPATMIAASDLPVLAAELQTLFSSSWLRIYTSEDVLGVELAGASKNVIAIAAGILDGLQAGHNAKSALLARGLAEITRLGTAMGASQETFFGLAGVGDLATTCFSPEGRNRSCGEALGRGEKLDAYLARTTSVVEGVATTLSLVDLARKYRVDMPITTAVHGVLFQNVDPIEAISRLMSRELKAERIG